MFERLKSALGKITSAAAQFLKTRELSEKELRRALDELKLSLLESDVAYDVAERICEETFSRLIDTRIERGRDALEVAREVVSEVLAEILDKRGPDVIEEALSKCSRTGEPYVVVFFGVNGSGKTTTIAKTAYALRNSGVTPVIVAADTFRAGAQEQLEAHARKLGVPIIRAKYGSDPASVALDAVSFAKNRGYCAVLIDTAGRMHTDPDLVEELRKIVRVVEPDLRVLVLDSLTGNDAVEQARRFEEAVGIDGLILTKVDADVKGGTAVSAVAATGKPILYIGVGQGYADLQRFSPRWLIERLLSEEE